jgi:hypothetical protein
MELFVVAAVRTSHPTLWMWVFVSRKLRVTRCGSCCDWVMLLPLFGTVRVFVWVLKRQIVPVRRQFFSCRCLQCEVTRTGAVAVHVESRRWLSAQHNVVFGPTWEPKLLYIECILINTCILSFVTYHIYSHLRMIFAYLLRSFIHSFTYKGKVASVLN